MAISNFTVVNVKSLIANFITLPIFGKALSSVFNNTSYYGSKIYLDNPFISNKNRASIFWNLYESSEARLIVKYLPKDLPVIEMGSSLGIISKLISDRIHIKLICIEANARLIPSIKRNLKEFPERGLEIVNAALSYSHGPIRFISDVTDNLTGHVGQTAGDIIPSITLQEIIRRFDIGRFVLVADIEGSEIEIFKLDSSSLKHCQWIIIELHNTIFEGRQYTVDELCVLVEEIGFILKERDGNCFAFINNQNHYLG